MDMWNWSVILQGTPALSVWVFVLLLGSIHVPLYSLICPQVPFWSESAKCLDGDSGHSWPHRLKGSSRDAEHSSFGSCCPGFPQMLLQLVQSSRIPSCLKAWAFNTYSESYPAQILLQATMWNPHNFRQLNQIKEYKTLIFCWATGLTWYISGHSQVCFWN